MIYWISWAILKVIFAIFFPIKVYGAKNIPTKKGFIIASNHLSNIDPLVIGLGMRRPLSFMAKESLFKNKAFGFFLRRVRAFSIKRSSSDIRAIKECLKRLKTGGVVIFPEGTRKLEGKDRRAYGGIGLLSVKGQVPVVPTFIIGSDRVMPAGSKFLRPGRITVYYGKPCHFLEKESYADIAEKIMREVYSLAKSHS